MLASEKKNICVSQFSSELSSKNTYRIKSTDMFTDGFSPYLS